MSRYYPDIFWSNFFISYMPAKGQEPPACCRGTILGRTYITYRQDNQTVQVIKVTIVKNESITIVESILQKTCHVNHFYKIDPISPTNKGPQHPSPCEYFENFMISFCIKNIHKRQKIRTTDFYCCIFFSHCIKKLH